MHIFYMENREKGELLKFKQQTLEQHASDLFDMLNAKALASFDEQRIRSKLQVRVV